MKFWSRKDRMVELPNPDLLDIASKTDRLASEVGMLRQEMADDRKNSKTDRWLDKPVARMTAVVALVAALGAAATLWPEGWWPRSIPPLDAALEPGAQWATIFAVTDPPERIHGAPTFRSADGCFGQPRQDWALNVRGYPVSEVRATMDITARRSTNAFLTSVDVVIDQRHSGFATGLLPCVEYFGTGGADYYERNVFIDFGTPSPSVTFRDENGNVVSSLAINLEKGDAAQLVFQPGVSGDSGEGFDWHANVNIIEDGKPEILRVPETGSFRIAALPKDPTYWTDEKQPFACRPGERKEQWCG